MMATMTPQYNGEHDALILRAWHFIHTSRCFLAGFFFVWTALTFFIATKHMLQIQNLN